MTDITAADINGLRTTLEVASKMLGYYHSSMSKIADLADLSEFSSGIASIRVAQIDVDMWRDKAIDIQRALMELHARRTGAEIAQRVFAGDVQKCLDNVWEAGGKAWDEVADPDAAIREMRSDDDPTAAECGEGEGGR